MSHPDSSMWSGLGYKQNHSINDEEHDADIETTSLWMHCSIFHYDAESMDHGSHTKIGSVHALPLVFSQFLGNEEGDTTIMGDTE